MSENTIMLYPSNWLYNAGVVGLLINLRKELTNEKLADVQPQMNDDGTVIIDKRLFSALNIKERFIEGDDKISIYRKGKYRNFLTTEDEKKIFVDFVKSLETVEKRDNCGLCNLGYYLPLEKILDINKGQPSDKKFLNRIKEFNFVHNSLLGPTVDKFPNAFWNNQRGLTICHLCNFLILHHHIALTPLAFYEDIFINAPSFKAMYELNKLMIETYGNMNREESKNKREILATSVIEYSRKIKSTLGLWTGMNIEIVSKYKVKNEKGQWDDRIEYFSLPSDVIKIISDRGIASALSELGEFRILNIVLNRNYSRLTEIAYKLLRESTKDFDKRNKKLIEDLFYRWDNRKNLTHTANKILMLYSLIEDKIRRS